MLPKLQAPLSPEFCNLDSIPHPSSRPDVMSSTTLSSISHLLELPSVSKTVTPPTHPHTPLMGIKECPALQQKQAGELENQSEDTPWHTDRESSAEPLGGYGSWRLTTEASGSHGHFNSGVGHCRNQKVGMGLSLGCSMIGMEGGGVRGGEGRAGDFDVCLPACPGFVSPSLGSRTPAKSRSGVRNWQGTNTHTIPSVDSQPSSP